MIKASFENVSFAQVQSILPKGSMIPTWTSFVVNVEIASNGIANVNLFNRYYFEMSKAEAFQVIATLS